MSATLASALWYVGRGAGVVALLTLTLTLILGIATRSGRALPGLPRFAVTAVHRSSSLLAVTFLVVHIVTLTLDPHSQLAWINALVPFTSSWRPLYVGLGALALDAILALVLTSLLRNRIGPRSWKAIHWAAYAAWPVAVGHVLGSGTDVGSAWMQIVLYTVAALMAGVLLWRVSEGFLDHEGRAPGSKLPVAPPRVRETALTGGMR